jgi:hypothetical protein
MRRRRVPNRQSGYGRASGLWAAFSSGRCVDTLGRVFVPPPCHPRVSSPHPAPLRMRPHGHGINLAINARGGAGPSIPSARRAPGRRGGHPLRHRDDRVTQGADHLVVGARRRASAAGRSRLPGSGTGRAGRGTGIDREAVHGPGQGWSAVPPPVRKADHPDRTRVAGRLDPLDAGPAGQEVNATVPTARSCEDAPGCPGRSSSSSLSSRRRRRAAASWAPHLRFGRGRDSRAGTGIAPGAFDATRGVGTVIGEMVMLCGPCRVEDCHGVGGRAPAARPSGDVREIAAGIGCGARDGDAGSSRASVAAMSGTPRGRAEIGAFPRPAERR